MTRTSLVKPLMQTFVVMDAREAETTGSANPTALKFCFPAGTVTDFTDDSQQVRKPLLKRLTLT